LSIASVATGAYGEDRWKKTAVGMTQIIEEVNYLPSTVYTLSGTGVTTQQITSPASGNWTLPDIAVTARLIQLEIGDTATPFEHRSYGDELQRCQRYYEIISRAIATSNYGTIWSQPLNVFSNCWTNVEFKVTKRATPSFGLLGSANWVGLTPNTINATENAIVFSAGGFFYLQGNSLGEPQAYVEAEL
jgi:hypothetical protein